MGWEKTSSFSWNDCKSVGLLYRPLTAQDLPVGFGFDKFGLLVRTTHAVDLLESEVDTADPPKLTTSDGVSQTNPVIDTTNENIDDILAAKSAEGGEDDSGAVLTRDAIGRQLLEG